MVPCQAFLDELGIYPGKLGKSNTIKYELKMRMWKDEFRLNTGGKIKGVTVGLVKIIHTVWTERMKNL